jgi:hypothetical protein
MIDFDEDNDGLFDLSVEEAVVAASFVGSLYEESNEEKEIEKERRKEEKEEKLEEAVGNAVDRVSVQGDPVGADRENAISLKELKEKSGGGKLPYFEQWVRDVALGRKKLEDD